MPKRASTVVVMQAYPPFSSRRWYAMILLNTCRAGRGIIRMELSIVGDPGQAGRVVGHEVPAIVAPGSPLCAFLKDGFGIELKVNEPFDLTQLVGRRVEVRFSRAMTGQEQAIVGVRSCAPHARIE